MTQKFLWRFSNQSFWRRFWSSNWDVLEVVFDKQMYVWQTQMYHLYEWCWQKEPSIGSSASVTELDFLARNFCKVDLHLQPRLLYNISYVNLTFLFKSIKLQPKASRADHYLFRVAFLDLYGRSLCFRQKSTGQLIKQLYISVLYDLFLRIFVLLGNGDNKPSMDRSSCTFALSKPEIVNEVWICTEIGIS